MYKHTASCELTGVPDSFIVALSLHCFLFLVLVSGMSVFRARFTSKVLPDGGMTDES